MTLPRFEFTDRARPFLEIGVGDSRVPGGQAVWDVARWDTPTATWSGTEPTWLDHTCDGFFFEYEYGRPRTTDRFVAGALTVAVHNASGWADPFATDDPSSLAMRPGRAIRIGVVHELYGKVVLWRGFIDALRPTYDPANPDFVTFSCIDALGEVNRAKFAGSADPVGEGESVTSRLSRVLDLATWPTSKRLLDLSTAPLVGDPLNGQAADLLGRAADSDGGVIFGDRDGNVVYRTRDWQSFATGTAPDGSIGNVDPYVPGDLVPAVPEVPGYLDLALGTVSTPDSVEMALTGAFRVTVRALLSTLAPTGFPTLVTKIGTGFPAREFQIYATGSSSTLSSSTANNALAANADATIVAPIPLGAPHDFGFESSPRSQALVALVDTTRTARTGAAGFAWPDSTAPITVGTVAAGFAGRIYSAQLEKLDARLVFPGYLGNFLSVPHNANLNPTTDVELVARIAPTSWRPTVQGTILAKYATAANQRGYQFALGTAGILVFAMSTTGADVVQAVSSSAIPTSSPTPLWVKVTRVRTTGATTFYTAPDSPTEPTTWTVLGTPQTLSAGTAIFGSTSVVEVGTAAVGLSNPFAGRISRAIVRTAIGGAAVLDVGERDAAMRVSPTGSTFVATTGQTVTVNDTSSGAALIGGASNVSTPDPGVLPATFTIVGRTRHGDNTGFPGWAQQNDGADPRSWVVFRTLNNGRWYIEATPDGVWANRQSRFATGTIPTFGVDVDTGVTIETNRGGRLYLTPWTRSGSGAWVRGTPTDAGAAVTPFDVTTLLRVGAGFPTGSSLLWTELRTGTDPNAGTLVWRFDASEWIGTGTTSTDPRGRVWTLTNATGLVPKVAPIVQPVASSLVWRFDASEYPGTGTTYADPRGRTWTLSAANAIVPKVPAVPEHIAPSSGDVCPGVWVRPFDRADIATRAIYGRDVETAVVVDDLDGQVVYGIEPFERTDLWTANDTDLTLLANRALKVRSWRTAPIVRGVELDARTSDGALDLMTTADPYLPSRYRCRLLLDRGLVFDGEYFVTGLVVRMDPKVWTMSMQLDTAAPFALVADSRWDSARWDRALWTVAV